MKTYKKLIIGGIAFAAVLGLGFAQQTIGACLTGSGGGTGICTATSTDVGKALVASDTFPFLTYKFSPLSSGSGTVGPSTSSYVGYFTASSTIGGNASFTYSNGVVSAANIESIRYADKFPGANIGAKINAAYADCPATGCQIFVPAGLYQYTTPIVINTYGKIVALVCPVGGGHFFDGATELQYTAATGTAFSVDTNNYVTAGAGIFNCNFIGPVGQGQVGSSVVTSTYAMQLGGTYGAFGFTLQNVHVSGFGTGIYVGSNVSFLTIDKSVINKNGQNYYSPQISGANGENMRIINSVFADSNNALFGESISSYCFQVQLSGNVQYQITGTSFDDCQIYSNQFGGTANLWHITNSHFENPNVSGSTGYDYIKTLSNQSALTIVSTANDYMQDLTAGASDEFVLNGGNFVSQGDTVNLNNNVTVPMRAFVTNQDATSVDTVSWTGLTQGYANTGSSAAITYVVNNWVGYSPTGYATGLGPLSFRINPSTGSSPFNGVGGISASNIEGVYYAEQYGGADIGAQVNNAYAAAFATRTGSSTIIVIPPGDYTFSTNIVCGTNGFRCLIEGTPGGGTTLRFTGTGAAITLNTGIQATGIDHTTGNGIEGISLYGNATATSTRQIGVMVGGTNGTDGAVLNFTNIYGFGYGLYTATNTYHFLYENGSIGKNGINVYVAPASNSGESIDFVNAFIVDTANNNPLDCFLVDNSGTASLNYTGGSLDDCQFHTRQANNITFTGTHFENPGSSAWGAYTYVLIDNNTATNVSINGAIFFNTASTSSTSPTTFISNGGTLTLNGVIARAFGGQIITSFVTTTGSGRTNWLGFNRVGTVVTNVVDSSGISSNGGNSTSSYTGAFLFPNITNSFLATDSTGKVIATTTPSAGSVTINGITTSTFNFAAAASLSVASSGNTITYTYNAPSGTSGYFPYWTGSTLAATSSIYQQLATITTSTTAIAYVSSVTSTVGAASTTLVLPAINTTSGYLLVLAVRQTSATVTSTVTDSSGNTWTRATFGSSTFPGGGGAWYAMNVAGGSDTITVTFGASTGGVGQVDQYSGVATSSALDASSTATSASSAVTTCDTGPLTTTLNGELVWGMCVQQSANSFALTSGGVFTKRGFTTRTGSQDQVVANAGTAVSSTWTIGTADQVIMAALSFKPIVTTNPGLITATGIGTTQPSSTFHVVGSGIFSGLSVGTTTTATGTAAFSGLFQLAASSSIVTPAIGGAIVSGGCDSATSTIDSSITSSTAAFITTPMNDPNATLGGTWAYSFLSSPGLITTRVCSNITLTPNTTTYLVKIIK